MGSRDGGYGSGGEEHPDLENRWACASCAALRAQLAAAEEENKRLREDMAEFRIQAGESELRARLRAALAAGRESRENENG